MSNNRATRAHRPRPVLATRQGEPRELLWSLS